MISLIKGVNYVTVLDHHETAEDELRELEDRFDNCTIIFDNTLSGATITRKYCESRGTYFDNDTNFIIGYITDRDLWKWKLRDSKELSEAMAFKIKKNSIQSFQDFIDQFSFEKEVQLGKILLSVTQKKVLSKADLKNIREVNLNGREFYCLNLTDHISETGNAICELGKPALMYFIIPDGTVIWSMRSTPDLGEISSVARKMGGGGHDMAAGFSTDIETLSKILFNNEN